MTKQRVMCGDATGEERDVLRDEAIGALASGLRRWIGEGGFQGPSGAFHAWRDDATGELAFAYPEITGYALTYLAGRDELTDREQAGGRRAADWLLARFAANDWSARAGWDHGAVYTFDLGMIATGLLAFGRRLGIEAYQAQGLALVRRLRNQINAHGELPAIAADGETGEPPSDRSGWSVDGRAHLLKVVQCFLLADDLGEPGAREAARLVAAYEPLQTDEGRFITQDEPGFTMLHPHLYAIEGLWIYGTAVADAAVLARARMALAWAWSHQLETGGFPRLVVDQAGPDRDLLVEQMDVTAQATRMALLLDRRLPRLDAAVARIGQVAVARAPGLALPYQPAQANIHLNAWATMFGAQAVELSVPGTPPLPWHALV